MKWEMRREYMKKFPDYLPLEAFDIYGDLVLEWNERMNLTRITDETDMMDKHFIDSLTVTLLEEFNRSGKILDLGTGAGFPGMVLALTYPDREVHLMDSLQKRITFLDEVVRQLNVSNVKTFHGRAEEKGQEKEFREEYEIVLSRAVARLPILCEYCLPFVKVGGNFIAMKGSEGAKESEEARKAISILGGQLERTVDLKLPGGDERQLIVIKKVKPTPKKYPRSGGKPRKDPISS